MTGALLVILSTAGESPTADHVAILGDVTWCKTEREGVAACLAARVRSMDAPTTLHRRARELAAAHGWALTIVPENLPTICTACGCLNEPVGGCLAVPCRCHHG